MLTKFLAIAAIVITLLTVGMGYTQGSSLVLRQQTLNPILWPRLGTTYYRSPDTIGRNFINQPPVGRSRSDSFRGGGPGSGK